MLRTFHTHKIRKVEELSGKLWSFTPLEGEKKGFTCLVPIPSCWETYPGFENYRGRALYQTSFEAEGNIRLEMKGVSHMAKVFLDGAPIASHYNAYTPFEAVAKDLRPGIHSLQVEVDNSFQQEYSLNCPNDYMSYGGISRGIELEHISDLFISGLHITPILKADGGWKARLEVYCTNVCKASLNVAFQIFLHTSNYLSEEIIVSYGKSKVLDTIMELEEVETWCPENPKLYDVHCVLLVEGKPYDDLIERTGFRSIECSKNRILLNKKPLRIKGVCRHEDHPQYGCALPFSAIAYDLQLIKDLGCNSIRTAHYPNDEIFLDLCDEIGLLVWEENHARGLDEKAMRNPYFEPQAEQVIKEMIEAHYNHPSIYIWGILNECASDTIFGRECYKKQYECIRTLDSSRPCSSATCKFKTDICLDLSDVVSWNIYPYWYENKTAGQMIDELYQWTQEKGNGVGKPFLITEIGAGAIYGFRSSDHDKWSEEYQVEALQKQLREVMAYENCMGLYIWQFCDNRISREWFSNRPRSRNNKGVVDEYRRHKLSYEVVKEIFHNCSNYWDE